MRPSRCQGKGDRPAAAVADRAPSCPPIGSGAGAAATRAARRLTRAASAAFGSPFGGLGLPPLVPAALACARMPRPPADGRPSGRTIGPPPIVVSSRGTLLRHTPLVCANPNNFSHAPRRAQRMKVRAARHHDRQADRPSRRAAATLPRDPVRPAPNAPSPRGLQGGRHASIGGATLPLRVGQHRHVRLHSHGGKTWSQRQGLAGPSFTTFYSTPVREVFALRRRVGG